MADAGSKSERDVRQDLDALRNDFDVLRKDVGQLVDSLKTSTTNKAEAELEDVRKRLNRLASDLQTSGREQIRSVESQVEERPLTTLAMAFAIGLFLGRFFDRR